MMNRVQRLKQFHRNRDIYWFGAVCQFVVAAVFTWIAWMRADTLYAVVALLALTAGLVSV